MSNEKSLFSIEVDGIETSPDFIKIKGSRLSAQVLPKSEWPSAADGFEEAQIYIFRTPIEEYVDLEVLIYELEGITTSMGTATTLIATGEVVEVPLEDDAFHDVVCVWRRADGTGGIAGGGRFSTGDVDDVPQALTLDELKLLSMMAIGISLDQAVSIEAKIVSMTAWSLHGRLIIAGFQFLGTKNWHYTAMANHMGGVEFSHGYTAAQVKKYLGF